VNVRGNITTAASLRRCRWGGPFVYIVALALVVSFLTSGCAFNIISVRQEAVHFVPAAEGHHWTLAEDTKVKLVEGSATLLKKGSTWRQVGEIEKGNVLHTDDQVVTVEASNQHEAEVVVSNNMIVGFYLRVEQAFTPAEVPVAFRSN
jgi:hypothetical protein